jgi:ABC-type multidrug transport system fused ATPase/permease subunit
MITCGFGAAVLNIVPEIEKISCCLIVPLAAVLSLILDHKANNNYSKKEIKKAFSVGAITGIFAAFFWTLFRVLIAFATKNSEINESLPALKKLFSSFPDAALNNSSLNSLSNMAHEINQYGFSSLYAIYTFIGSSIVYTVFGIIGSLIGMRILNNRIGSNL